MVTKHQREAVSCSVVEDTCMKGQSANEQVMFCTAQMKNTEEVFPPKT